MLRVFDAETMIARAVFFCGMLVNVQDSHVRLVADGVDHHLEADLIRALDALEHDTFGQHLIEKQAASIRGVIIWLEEERGGRAETAIGESFQTANAQHIAAKSGANSRLRQHFP